MVRVHKCIVLCAMTLLEESFIRTLVSCIAHLLSSRCKAPLERLAFLHGIWSEREKTSQLFSSPYTFNTLELCLRVWSFAPWPGLGLDVVTRVLQHLSFAISMHRLPCNTFHGAEPSYPLGIPKSSHVKRSTKTAISLTNEGSSSGPTQPGNQHPSAPGIVQ